MVIFSVKLLFENISLTAAYVIKLKMKFTSLLTAPYCYNNRPLRGHNRSQTLSFKILKIRVPLDIVLEPLFRVVEEESKQPTKCLKGFSALTFEKTGLKSHTNKIVISFVLEKHRIRDVILTGILLHIQKKSSVSMPADKQQQVT